LTWSETSSKSARPANDFESCETVSIAESAQCPLVRCPAQPLVAPEVKRRRIVTCLPRRKERESGLRRLADNQDRCCEVRDLRRIVLI
jgi:hypothetical protein